MWLLPNNDRAAFDKFAQLRALDTNDETRLSGFTLFRLYEASMRNNVSMVASMCLASSTDFSRQWPRSSANR